MRPEQFAGWTPIRVYRQDAGFFVDWCYLGAERFTHPFFEQTVEACLRRPFNQLFRQQTPVEDLAEWYARSPGLRPSGFIFHMSRCGSTLVSQMLSALPHSLVISEASPIDTILRANVWDASADVERRVDWLRWMVSALGQRHAARDTRDDDHKRDADDIGTTGGARHARVEDDRDARFFIKFDAWNTLQLPLVRRAFPDVPCIFLYREPNEVMVSQLRRAASWMLSGNVEPSLLGVSKRAVFELPRAEYCARALAKICEAALLHAHADLRLVNYNQLPGALYSSLADFFGVARAPADFERVRHVAQFDAKQPSFYFEDDLAAKDHAATEEIRRLTEHWLRPLYEQLEAARRSCEATQANAREATPAQSDEATPAKSQEAAPAKSVVPIESDVRLKSV